MCRSWEDRSKRAMHRGEAVRKTDCLRGRATSYPVETRRIEESSAMSLKRPDRMREVPALLRDRGEVDSQVLRTELRVSAATLRRDLSELEDQGLLMRTHGCARALEPSR